MLAVIFFLAFALCAVLGYPPIKSLLFGDRVTNVDELSELVGELPAFDDNPYFTINGNKADFDEDLVERANRGTFENYGKLDKHGRATGALACVSRETMPASGEDRGDISSVHPSGWKSGMNWERCHLIAWSLSAENDNERNLITGTHMMNVEGMKPFEESISRYIDETGNKVLYEVTPIYDGRNLVASGVHMRAWSVEDKGRGINFNIYCYNVSPGYEIDYMTGIVTELDGEGQPVEYGERTYVINTSSKKFHYKSCSGAADIAGHNRKEVRTTRSRLIDEGYEPCGICEP